MFHMLRRQMKRNLRLPLVVMTPKSMLRLKHSVSSMSELADGQFQLIIGETQPPDAAAVKRIVLCSGKIYYELLEAREKEKREDIALVRLEQLYPFPREQYQAVIAAYPNAKEVVWCQEEPENQGAWYQIKHRLRAYLAQDHQLLYATRKGMATTAVGYLKVHQAEQAQVIHDGLFDGKPLAGGC
jgi:2-oxoglutarate dehydrogenase E1 component